MHRARTIAVALAAAGIVTATAACSGTPQKPASATATASATTAKPAAATLPPTPPGAQARWLLGAIAHQPIPASAITAHFDQVFLGKIPPAQLTATLGRVKSLRLDAVLESTSEFVVLSVTDNGQPQAVSLAVDAHGLINGLLLTAGTPEPTLTVPTTWTGVDRQVQQAAPQTRLLVAKVTGGACQTVNAVDATTPAPLGSAFKLYVLDALARAIARGTVSWDQRLTLTSQLKSLPSGELSTEPAGTQVTVLQAAQDMISSSDNTAADLLLTLVGRTAVEAAATSTGMADPALDTPFLTTRELFVLKLDDWPALASRYLALDAAGRQALLTGTVDRVPLSALHPAAPTGWTQPRDVGTIEWFASPADICRVYVSLDALSRQPGLAPVASILEINNGGMSLDPAHWTSVWFKGGSEPGVLTLNYLATTRTGQSYMVSALTANPTAPIPAAAAAQLIGAIKAAFTLAAG